MSQSCQMQECQRAKGSENKSLWGQIEGFLRLIGERGNVFAAGRCGSLIWKQQHLLFYNESMALTGSSEDNSQQQHDDATINVTVILSHHIQMLYVEASLMKTILTIMT